MYASGMVIGPIVPTSLIVLTLSIGVADGEGDEEVVVAGGSVLVWAGVVVVVVTVVVPAQAVTSIETEQPAPGLSELTFSLSTSRIQKLVE